MSNSAYPEGFLWGVATSGHQVEGNNSNSDTWFLENVSPTIFAEPSRAACDSWNRWEEDLDLVVGLGLNAYRFSVEWARVEPSDGQFSDAVLDHYERIVIGCIARGLAPIVTFNHFTSPHWFAQRGGWLHESAPKLFARYCGVVMERFGDRISIAVTLNEPNLPQVLAWSGLPDFVAELTASTLDAASSAAGVEKYRAANVMLERDFDGMRAGMTAGHRAARAVIKQHRPELPVGVSLAIVDDRATPDGTALRDQKRSDAYLPWLLVARDDDFIGVQNYEQAIFGPSGPLPPREGAPLNGMGTAIESDSLRGAIEYAYSVSRVPVLVTEHGLSTLDDSLRVAFIEPALAGLDAAVASGVPVLGYCHWTLMDNFEWIFGYGPRLGLYAVDRSTYERTAKPSSIEFTEAVRRRR
jgi:beta-glucosidase